MTRTRLWVVALVAAGSPAWPQAGRPSPLKPIEKLERMSPDQRRKLFEELPPDRAHRLRRQFEDYERMPPQQRQRLTEQYEWFSKLPAGEQQRMRKLFSRYEALAEHRQDAVRHEYNSLREMSEPDRRARTKSSDFRSEYSKDEQKLIEEMSKAVPE